MFTHINCEEITIYSLTTNMNTIQHPIQELFKLWWSWCHIWNLIHPPPV